MSAYHAQSQEVIERFHQTLKSLLRAYCIEMERDLEEALPWLLLAAREAMQLTLLYDQWKEMETPKNQIL